MPRVRLETNCACCDRAFTTARSRNPVYRSSDVTHLCDVCNEEALNENAHSDGRHEADANGPQDDCHVCQDVNPHEAWDGQPTPTVTPVREGAGRVTSEADGRLKPNAPTLPENPERVKLVGQRLGEAAPKYNGIQASVIKRDNHVWGGHSSWVMVIPDGMTTRRWFWTEDVRPVRASRARSAS